MSNALRWMENKHANINTQVASSPYLVLSVRQLVAQPGFELGPEPLVHGRGLREANRRRDKVN
jgi:hypothetical protein